MIRWAWGWRTGIAVFCAVLSGAQGPWLVACVGYIFAWYLLIDYCKGRVRSKRREGVVRD